MESAGVPEGKALAASTVRVPLPLVAGGMTTFVVVPPAATATGADVDVLTGTAADEETPVETLGDGAGVVGTALELPPPPHPTTSVSDARTPAACNTFRRETPNITKHQPRSMLAPFRFR